MTTCPLCRKNQQRHLFTSDNRIYLECTCGFIFSRGSGDSEKSTPTGRYTETYYSPWELDRGTGSPARISKYATFSSWLGRIERYTPAKGQVLDIGCATGFFLDIAGQHGWSITGVDVSAFAIAEARKLTGGQIFAGTLHGASFNNRQFNCVTAFDVIEHVTDITGFIGEVSRITAPGGTFAVSTANTDSLSRRLLGKRWPQFKPEHCSYFSPATIRRLFSLGKFEIISTGPARKMLNMAFIESYFRAYPSFPVGAFFRTLARLLPQKVKAVPLTFPTGEMLVIARKAEDS
jgi:SAM-dependent methyltransferase